MQFMIIGWKRNLVAEGVEPNPGPFLLVDLELVLKRRLGAHQLSEKLKALIAKLHQATFDDFTSVYLESGAVNLLQSDETAQQIPGLNDEEKLAIVRLRSAFLEAIEKHSWNEPITSTETDPGTPKKNLVIAHSNSTSESLDVSRFVPYA
jgi:hypothetical protein